MLALPSNVTPYKTIGPFTEQTIPKGLLRDHNTKSGVWGLLEVTTGEIRYVITQPSQEYETSLTTEQPGVIAPLQVHYIEPKGSVEFTVTFYRVPA